MHISGWIYGITIAITITIGGFASLSLSHTLGTNKTRIAYAVSNGSTKAGQSTCLNFGGDRFVGCNPQSATVMENTLSQNLSPGDPLALSVSRTNGTARLNVGVSTSAKDPSGYVRVGVSATKSYGGRDALSIIDSAPVQAFLPANVNKKAHALLRETKPKTDWFEAWQKCEEQRKVADKPALIARLQTQTGKGVGRKVAFDAGRAFQTKNCFLVANP